MHVGVFADELSPDVGGGYTFINDVTESFIRLAGKSQHSFSVFCAPDAARSLRLLGLPANINVIDFRPRRRVERLITTLKHVLPVFGYLWRRPSRLERTAKANGVEVVWFVGGYFDTPNIPYIATIWDVQHLTHPWFPEVSADWRWEYRDLFLWRHLRRATAIITGTQIGKDQLTAFFGVSPDRISIIPHPTPAFSLSTPRDDGKWVVEKYHIKKPYLIYPAQFWAHKNHINLILALKQRKNSGNAVPDLVFVGSDKGNRQFVKNKVEEFGLSSSVYFLGFVEIADLVALYQNAIGLIYPSFSGPENLPPLEAFSLCCPVAVAEYPGAREQLGNNAIYFNPESEVSINESIDQIMSGTRNGKNGIELARKRAESWTGREYAEAVLALISKLEAFRRVWP